MVCHGFKGGIGTASRVLAVEDGGYTVGVLVQANHGDRERLSRSRAYPSAAKSRPGGFRSTTSGPRYAGFAC